MNLGHYHSSFALPHAPFAVQRQYGYQYTADPRWSAILSIGLLSANVPTPEAIWGLTLSPFRGLFFVSPILLLTLPGLVLLRRSSFRAEWITTLSIVLGFFVLVSASAQWWGGWSAGPRYLVPLLPFLVWPLTAIFDRIARMTSAWRVGAWLSVAGLIVVSIVNVWSLTLGGQYYAPDDVMNPLIEYSWSHVIAGDVARNWGMSLVGERSARRGGRARGSLRRRLSGVEARRVEASGRYGGRGRLWRYLRVLASASVPVTCAEPSRSSEAERLRERALGYRFDWSPRLPLRVLPSTRSGNAAQGSGNAAQGPADSTAP